MLWRSVKAQLWVLLCAGLVGPIFLIVYFASGREWRDSIQWIFFVGLLITAVDVLIALALASYGAKSAEKTAALEQSGNIPLNRMVDDVRSKARQQLQAVVRRAAGQQAQAPAPTPAAHQAPAAPLFTAPEPSIAQRLQELETLRATGAVTDAEYTAKRAQIILEI